MYNHLLKEADLAPAQAPVELNQFPINDSNDYDEEYDENEYYEDEDVCACGYSYDECECEEDYDEDYDEDCDDDDRDDEDYFQEKDMFVPAVFNPPAVTASQSQRRFPRPDAIAKPFVQAAVEITKSALDTLMDRYNKFDPSK